VKAQPYKANKNSYVKPGSKIYYSGLED